MLLILRITKWSLPLIPAIIGGIDFFKVQFGLIIMLTISVMMLMEIIILMLQFLKKDSVALLVHISVVVGFAAIITYLVSQDVFNVSTTSSGDNLFGKAGAIGLGVMLVIILFGSIFVSGFWGIKKFHLFLVLIYCFQFLMILGSWEMWFMIFNPHGRSLRTPWALPYIIASDLILFVIEGKLVIRTNEKYQKEFVFQLDEKQVGNIEETNQANIEESVPRELTNSIDKWKALIEGIKCQMSLWTKRKKD